MNAQNLAGKFNQKPMTPEKYEKLRQNEPVLCYVDGGKAYFTTQKLEDQWGDDWDDAPYEHNAGIPTKPCWHREQRNCPCDICEREWDGLTPNRKMKDLKIVYEWLKNSLKEWWHESWYERKLGAPVLTNIFDSKQKIALKAFDEANNQTVKYSPYLFKK